MNAGGVIELERIDGYLNMARAIGDHYLKNDKTRLMHEQKLVSIPDF